MNRDAQRKPEMRKEACALYGTEQKKNFSFG